MQTLVTFRRKWYVTRGNTAPRIGVAETPHLRGVPRVRVMPHLVVLTFDATAEFRTVGRLPLAQDT